MVEQENGVMRPIAPGAVEAMMRDMVQCPQCRQLYYRYTVTLTRGFELRQHKCEDKQAHG